MATYIVRVELHRVVNYSALNAAMRQEGFQTTVTDTKGIAYHLPTGEYALPFGIVPTKGDTILRVKAAVARALLHEPLAVRTLNATPAILVTDADDGVSWSGLAPVL